MDEKEKKSCKKVENNDEGVVVHAIYVIIGSIPIVVILIMCANLIYIDFVKNNYSFYDKSIFLSNIESHVFELKVECGRGQSGMYSADGEKKKSGGNLKYQKCYANNNALAGSHECIRYFNDFLVSESEVDLLKSLSQKAFAYSKSKSVLTTFDIYNGHLTSGTKEVINLKKSLKNENIFSPNEVKSYLNVKNKVLGHIRTKFGVKNLYLTKPVLFAKLSGKKGSEIDDVEYWNDQIDDADAPHTCFTAIVQFSTYVKEFLGSRFQFRNADNRTILSIQPKKARVLIYTTGSENEYYVEKIQKGDFITLKFSFTCDQAYELVSSEDEDFFKV